MRLGNKVLLAWAIVSLAVIVTAPAMAEPADPMEATISLGRDPEPPFCVSNQGGGSVEITWDIEYATTPMQVKYRLEDPSRTIILDSQTYPGATGTSITRTWNCPFGLAEGKYWVRVEYYSFESGNEANAEVTFYVCSGAGSICGEKWQDTDCDEELTGADTPVPNWWICLDTPYDETYCLQTGPDGRVCWNGIAPGDYRIWEVVLGGWYAVYPTSYDIVLENGQTITEIFFNSQCAPPSACCFPDGHCEVLPVGVCEELGGIVYADVDCTLNPCPQPAFACCLPLDETCYMMTEADCLAAGGVWYDGMVCTSAGGDFDCPLYRVCCLAEDCYIITEVDCASQGGQWHPELTSCGPPNPCEIPVPADPDSWGAIKSIYR